MAPPSKAKLIKLFHSFDTSGDGVLSLKELTAALDRGGKKVSAEDVKSILDQVDKNGDGQVQFTEFVKVFKLAPDKLIAMPGLRELVDVSGALMEAYDVVVTPKKWGSALGKAGGGLVKTAAQTAKIITPRAAGEAFDIKDTTFDWKDSNVANIGSAEDKAARKKAAQAEPAWKGAGKAVGVKIWRVEQFKVVPWAKERYGEFYEGDSYIVLHTYKEEGTGGRFTLPKLHHTIFFWLGAHTTQDEMGVAAYKTVELDDLLDGEPEQHREVMLHESELFHELFPDVSYLKGGVESGFNRVEPAAYCAKLMLVKKVNKTTSVVEVPCERASLNEGDAFVLDCGAHIYVWAGVEASPFERLAANVHAEKLVAVRSGAAKATSTIDPTFWEKLGGEGKVKSKAEAGEVVPERMATGEGVLYLLSDETGKLKLEEVERGELKRSMLTNDDVYLIDAQTEVIMWIGSLASQRERQAGFNTASYFLRMQSRPLSTPVTVLKEGQGRHNPLYKKIMWQGHSRKSLQFQVTSRTSSRATEE